MYGKDKDKYRVKNVAGANATLQEFDEESRTWKNVGKKNTLNLEQAIVDMTKAKLGNLSDKEIKEFNEQAEGYIKDLALAGIDTTKHFNTLGSELANYAQNGVIDLTSLGRGEIQKLKTSQITDKDLKAAVETAQKEANRIWGESLRQMSYVAVKEVENLANHSSDTLSNISQETLLAYGDTVDAIYAGGGSYAAEQFASGIKTILEKNEV
jgi:hypothetical protein